MYIYFSAQPDCRNVLIEYCDTVIKQQLCGEKWYDIKLFKFNVYFVTIFVAFTPNWCFSTTVVSVSIGPRDTSNSTQRIAGMYQQTATETP